MSSGGLVYDAKTGSPFILSFPSGNEAVDSTHKLRLRFAIPSNLAVLQKTTLSFSGLPFRSGLQSTTGGTTSNATTPGSTTANASLDIDLFIPIFKESGLVGPFVNVDYDVDSNSFALISGSDKSVPVFEVGGHEHHHTVPGSSHTHVIPAESLNNPSGLYETGMARNVHLYVDGVDVSTSVTDSSGNAGPWDGAGSEFDVAEIDISAYIQAGGFHEIQLSSTAIGGIKAFVYSFGLLASI